MSELGPPDGDNTSPSGRPGTRILVLGEARLVDTHTSRPLPRGAQGLLLQTLILAVNTRVERDVLLQRFYPGVDEESAAARLRVVATRLRRHLGEGPEIKWVEGGYQLAANADQLDLVEFNELADRALAGDREAANQALALWRGDPFGGFAVSEETRRQRLRIDVMRQRVEQVTTGAISLHTHIETQTRPNLEGAVARTRLSDTLPPSGGTRLIAVTGPAGAGKSILLAQWAERQAGRLSWRRVRAGTQATNLFAGLGTELADRTWLSNLDRGELAARLANRIGEMTEPAALVLDDFHLAAEPLQAEVQSLLEVAPPNLTLAIASRRSVPFPTGRFLASGAMVAVDAGELAFTLDETKAATHTDRHHLSETQVQRLHEVTAGLPWAIKELAPAVGDIPEADLATWMPESVDHLVDEMLEGLPPRGMELMASTAHIDVIGADLASKLSGTERTQELLHELASRYLLLTPRAEGYSHHPLVAHGLRQRPDHARRAAELHRRTASWHADRGDPALALDHSLAAGDRKSAESALEAGLEIALRRGDGSRLERWATSIDLPTRRGGPATALAPLAATMLGLGARKRRWRKSGSGADPVVRAAIEAMERARTGDCAGALVTIEAARQHLDPESGTQPETHSVVERLLVIVERGCRTMLGEAEDTVAAPPPPPSHTLWPWLYAWESGELALRAYVSAGPIMAGTLMEHGDSKAVGADESWCLLGSGATSVVRALVACESSSTPQQRRKAVAVTETAVRRVATYGNAPVEVLALYALHRAHLDHGDRPAAEEARTRADHLAGRMPHLPFLGDFREAAASRHAGKAPISPAVDSLTEAELTVFRFLGTGLTFAEVSDTLYVSPHTVRTHVRSIYRKLGISRRAEANQLLRDLAVGARV